MAWQTPKTDWTGADGVRYSDMNRIEGNILDLYNKSMLRADLTLYVDPSGNDTTGNGSSASPFATFMRALAAIPKNFNNAVVTIDVGAGEYAEDIVIRDFSGVLNIYSAGIVRFQSLTVERCSIYQYGFQTNFTNGISLNYGATYTGQSMMYVSGTRSIGVSVRNGSTFVLYNTVTISNTTSAAIEVSGGSRAYVSTLAGTNNNTAIRADTGSIASYGTINITATTRHFTNTGGRIYTGAQTSVPNY